MMQRRGRAFGKGKIMHIYLFDIILNEGPQIQFQKQLQEEVETFPHIFSWHKFLPLQGPQHCVFLLEKMIGLCFAAFIISLFDSLPAKQGVIQNIMWALG